MQNVEARAKNIVLIALKMTTYISTELLSLYAHSSMTVAPYRFVLDPFDIISTNPIFAFFR